MRDMARFALHFELSDVPGRVQLLPVGPRIVGRDGREFLFDELSQQTVLDAYQRGAVKLPIDINHSTEFAAPKGGDSPARGWIDALHVIDGALWGDVDWTDAGRASVGAREYRYLSPVFEFDTESMRVLRITSVALTNTPNLRLQALNSEQRTMRSALLLAAIAGALKLQQDASDDAIANAINALAADRERALNAQQPALDRFVPRADYDALVQRATNAETQLRERTTADHKAAVDDAIDRALKAGKITPATEQYHRATCAEVAGLARFKEFVAAAPVIAPDTGQLDGKPKPTTTALNAEEQQVARSLGLTDEEFIKARAA